MREVYKGYIISTDKMNPRFLVIATEGRGGKIPNCLSGLFTSFFKAKEFIDFYDEVKKVKNANKEERTD